MTEKKKSELTYKKQKKTFWQIKHKLKDREGKPRNCIASLVTSEEQRPVSVLG